MGSWISIYNNSMWGVHKQTYHIADLQDQISSGNRIRQASDGPSDAYRILSLRGDVAQYTQYEENINEVKISLGQADNSLQQLSDINTRVTQLISQGASGTYSQANREAIAGEINELLEQALGLGNTCVLDRYIFAGENSMEPPYEATRNSSGDIVSVEYVGSNAERPVPVAQGVTLSGQIVGDDIFRTDSRQDPEFVGDSVGIKNGRGTSSATGDFWMNISHAQTAYPTVPDSGLQAGTNSNADTLVGTHSVTISGDKIKLDNGSEVTFAAGDTNVKLVSDDGSILNVDVSAGVTDGTYDITGLAEVEIDGQKQQLTAEEMASDNVAINTPDGKILYIDATELDDSGDVGVHVPGTGDIFNTLVYLRDSLINKDGLDETQQMEAIKQAQVALDETGTGFVQRSTMIGGRLGSLEKVEETLDEMKFLAENEASATEEADIVELTTDLARTQTLYQLSLMATSKALSTTLMDFIN